LQQYSAQQRLIFWPGSFDWLVHTSVE